MFGGIVLHVEQPLFVDAIFETRDQFPVGAGDGSPNPVVTFDSPGESAWRNRLIFGEMLDDVEAV